MLRREEKRKKEATPTTVNEFVGVIISWFGETREPRKS